MKHAARPAAQEIGHLWWVGKTRVYYTVVREGRNGLRSVTWQRLAPEAFRGEGRHRRARPIAEVG